MSLPKLYDDEYTAGVKVGRRDAYRNVITELTNQQNAIKAEITTDDITKLIQAAKSLAISQSILIVIRLTRANLGLS